MDIRKIVKFHSFSLGVVIFLLFNAANLQAAEELCLDFQVNTYTVDHQSNPAVSGLSGGGFVVVWTSLDQDGSGGGIYGQRFESSGDKISSEFRINTYVDDVQSNPSVSAVSGGGFIVVWDSFGQDGSDRGIYGQRYDNGGNEIEGEFQINTHTNGLQRNPSIAVLPGGDVVVVWASEGQDSSDMGVYGQVFGSSGAITGSEFRVNKSTDGDQTVPSVSGLSEGGFVVTWSSLCQVYAQRFDQSNHPIGDEFLVNTYTDDCQKNSSVTGLLSGNFIITWTSQYQDGFWYGVYGQVFDSSGNKVGNEFMVNTSTAREERNSSVTGLTGGGFVVTWEAYLTTQISHNQISTVSDVYGQEFDSAGNRVGGEFQVRSDKGSIHWKPSVAGLTNDCFAVVWASFGGDGDKYGVTGRLFKAAGGDSGGNNGTSGGDNNPNDSGGNDGGGCFCGLTFCLFH